jgi:hypothetical protein
LISKSRNNELKDYKFKCQICYIEIDIRKFYQDIFLNGIIDTIWSKININNNIICDSVLIFRNSSWEPIIPEYVK